MSDACDIRIRSIERPTPRLLLYYALSSLALGPLFFVPLIPRYLRYRTLRYRFDEEGVSAAWGRLFRREVHLTYDRIQDIHLRSNVVERWLGLARIEIQTASGSAKAEMTIEGIETYNELRDYLYREMRGAAAEAPATPAGTPPVRPAAAASESSVELARVLNEVAAELRALRETVEARRPRTRDEVDV